MQVNLSFNENTICLRGRKMKYYKAILNKTGEVFFTECGENDVLPKSRIEAAEWDCKLIEIDKEEYIVLSETINQRNKDFHK